MSDVTVSDVDEVTLTPVPATPPKLTVDPVTNPVPVMVTEVPPDEGPVAVLSDVSVGATAVYENWEFAADAVPVEFVTTMFAVPVVIDAGTTIVALVVEATVTEVAAVPPTVTVMPTVKFVPVRVTATRRSTANTGPCARRRPGFEGDVATSPKGAARP